MATGRSTATDLDIYEDEEEKQFKQIYKILIIGDSNVGKTALLTRFVEGRFQSAFMSTVGERSSKIMRVMKNVLLARETLRWCTCICPRKLVAIGSSYRLSTLHDIHCMHTVCNTYSSSIADLVSNLYSLFLCNMHISMYNIGIDRKRNGIHQGLFAVCS